VSFRSRSKLNGDDDYLIKHGRTRASESVEEERKQPFSVPFIKSLSSRSITRISFLFNRALFGALSRARGGRLKTAPSRVPLIKNPGRRDECYPKQSNGSPYQSSSFLGEPKDLEADLLDPSAKADSVTTMQISFGPAQFFTHGRLRH